MIFLICLFKKKNSNLHTWITKFLIKIVQIKYIYFIDAGRYTLEISKLWRSFLEDPGVENFTKKKVKVKYQVNCDLLVELDRQK